MRLRVGVVGDRDRGFRPHVVTDDALGHAAAALGVEIDVRWLPTPSVLEATGLERLSACDGLAMEEP